MKRLSYLLIPLLMCCMIGCGSSKKAPAVGGDPSAIAANLPEFTLATSEYPSWSTFMVARKAGLIGETGKAPGVLEKKWGVRLNLSVKDYDTCLSNYGSKTVDAVCVTNIDVLNLALSRPTTAILATSTSDGADKWISLNAKNIDDAEGKKTYGLEKSVSDYVFTRILEIKGKDRSKYPFESLDPAAAATAFQTGSKDVTNIMVWNPYALQSIRSSDHAVCLGDSSLIPEEVTDMVVVGNDVLKKPSGDKFSALICDVFYNVTSRMTDTPEGDKVYKALGEDFSNLDLLEMKVCCTETSFYSTPESAIKLFESKHYQNNITPKVVQTCQKIKILAADEPTIGWQDDTKQLNFETKFIKMAAEARPKK